MQRRFMHAPPAICVSDNQMKKDELARMTFPLHLQSQVHKLFPTSFLEIFCLVPDNPKCLQTL